MVYKIILKKRFQNKLERLLTYIEGEFGLVIAQKFAQLLERKFHILQQQPFIGQRSPTIREIRSIRAGKHSRVYYRVEKNKIIVINMYDTRINPKRSKYK